MRIKALWTVVLALMLSSPLFQGCASTSTDKPLCFKDFESLKKPIRIARYVDEEYRVIHSTGHRIASTIGVDSLIGGAVASVGVRAWERGVEKEIAAANVPKINELVMRKFVERSGKEIPGWPPMIVEEQPVKNKKDYFKQYSGTKMLFLNATNRAPCLYTGYGFGSYFYGFLVDSEGDVIWGKIFTYFSQGWGRQKSVEEYKADNFKLFKEEIEFAADTIVSDFIEDIKKGVNAPEGATGTEGEQKTVSPEKLSQEQTQQKEEPKDYGTISITSEPPGAKIFIDGEYKGQTPAEISLSTGTYQLFLQHQLFEPHKESVSIEKGQTKTVNIKLSPEGKE
jgi:hypothetical protein